MTRDDIDDLMRDNGIVVVGEAVYALCQLVAAAEREKVAAWMMARGYATGHGDTIEDLLVELEWQVRESEREACAKVCEDRERANLYGVKECAAAIRARGQA